MLVKNSLHLVLPRIVLAYLVWQGDKSEEIELQRGGRLLGGGWEVEGAAFCLGFSV